MNRKTLIALAATLALGSTAFATPGIDGDANPIPGQTVQAPAGFGSAYASASAPAVAGVSAAELAVMTRLSRVH